jgi:hypothetical protein
MVVQVVVVSEFLTLKKSDFWEHILGGKKKKKKW